jgi:hypothetical protein
MAFAAVVITLAAIPPVIVEVAAKRMIHMATIKARNNDVAAAVPIVRRSESASDF